MITFLTAFFGPVAVATAVLVWFYLNSVKTLERLQVQRDLAAQESRLQRRSAMKPPEVESPTSETNRRQRLTSEVPPALTEVWYGPPQRPRI